MLAQRLTICTTARGLSTTIPARTEDRLQQDSEIPYTATANMHCCMGYCMQQTCKPGASLPKLNQSYLVTSVDSCVPVQHMSHWAGSCHLLAYSRR